MAQGLAKTGRSLMQEITSVSNNKIKEAAKLHQKKYRTESGLFLIEGYKPIFEAFQQKAHIETVYVTKDHIKKNGTVCQKTVPLFFCIIPTDDSNYETRTRPLHSDVYHSIGVLPMDCRYSLAFEKWRQPKNPR